MSYSIFFKVYFMFFLKILHDLFKNKKSVLSLELTEILFANQTALDCQHVNHVQIFMLFLIFSLTTLPLKQRWSTNMKASFALRP